MNILYVAVVIAFTVTLISNLEDSMLVNKQAKQKMQNRVSDVILGKEIAEITIRALDIFKTNNSTCPNGTRVLTASGIPNACWPSGNGNCISIQSEINSSQGVQNQICFTNQNITSNFNDKIYEGFLKTQEDSIYGLFLCNMLGCDNKSMAADGQNLVLANTTGFGTYVALENRVSPPGGGSSAGINFSSFPAAVAGNQINTNRINCANTNTECFTLRFCLNGLTTCNNVDRFIQTFAIRRF